ncbi:TRAP transporter substrate-binding protein [Selenomonas sp. TAMA-11512]|uniref:DctP family TRAP transporter solute-binding subunit n=1 Tax=Selenomonas sp. TAMA-11512 TaxID=3095337 RepID=UPI0030901FE2|nr:TRAP transporter substrate-binding protein [Selenomonas sp. TAMA-11512]
MKKKWLALLMTAVVAVVFAGCGGEGGSGASNAPADKKEGTQLLGKKEASIHLKVGVTTAPDGHYVKGLQAMQQKLEELSGGTMTLDIYPNSALGGESDMMDAVSNGTQDMVLSSTGPIPAFSKNTANWSTLDLPYLFENREQAYKVFDSPIGDGLLAEFDGTGIKAVGFWENGFREVTNNKKEIKTPADLQGMKIRTMENHSHMATYAALGSTPTAMAWGEIFSALQQGTVDGQENPLAIILTAKVYEVQKYISMIDLFYSPCVLMINEGKYNGFTDEQKKWFDEAAQYAKGEQRRISQEIDAGARAEMESKGIIITDVNKAEWKETVKSVYNDASLNIDQDLLARIQAATK